MQIRSPPFADTMQVQIHITNCCLENQPTSALAGRTSLRLDYMHQSIAGN